MKELYIYFNKSNDSISHDMDGDGYSNQDILMLLQKGMLIFSESNENEFETGSNGLFSLYMKKTNDFEDFDFEFNSRGFSKKEVIDSLQNLIILLKKIL